MAEARPMQTFHAEVVRVEDLSPAMRRIVFGGPSLAGYWTTGVGDEYLRVMFPEPGQQKPDLPAVNGDRLDYSSIDMRRLRTYTVRAFDPETGELTIDFVIHEGGVAAQWAAAAAPGMFVGVNSPASCYNPPDDLQWQILVADYAGLPAALRLVESAPAGVRTRLVLEISDSSHRIEIPSDPDVEVTWVIGGNGAQPSRLEEIVRRLPRPEGVGYIWVAGEAGVVRSVRRLLRHEFGLPGSAYRTVGYWVEKAEEWDARFAALDEETKRTLDALWDRDEDPEVIEDEYDKQLIRLGL